MVIAAQFNQAAFDVSQDVMFAVRQDQTRSTPASRVLESCHFFPLALFDNVVSDTVEMLSLRDLSSYIESSTDEEDVRGDCVNTVK